MQGANIIMIQRYADKQIKLFSLTSNPAIAEKISQGLLVFHLENCHHVNFLMAKL